MVPTTEERLRMLAVKPFLFPREACELFSIGINRMDRMLAAPDCPFLLRMGDRRMVNREKLAEYLNNVKQI